MTPDDFRRIALNLDGAEESSHMGSPDFRVGGRIFATLASQSQGYGNLMLTPELQAAFVADSPDVFLPVHGGWGRLGATHIRLAGAGEDVLMGALRRAWKLRVEKNRKPARRGKAVGMLLVAALGLPLFGQATPPAALTPVQIDNANSTSKLDDVQVPEADPARPTITNPARLPPVGYLQFEQGFVQANTSPGLGHQFNLAQITKLSIHRLLMLEVLFEPFAWTAAPDGHSGDAGDLVAGVQGLLLPQDGLKPAVAVAYEHVLRSGAAANLDVGSFTQSAVLLIGGDIGNIHYDWNFLLNEQSGPGYTGATLRRAQYGQTLSVSRPILSGLAGDKLGLTGELWHFTQPLPTTDTQGRTVVRANAVGVLVTLGYAVAPNFILDIAVDHGFTSTSTRWQGLAGFTYMLPHRLWKQRATAPAPPPHRRICR